MRFKADVMTEIIKKNISENNLVEVAAEFSQTLNKGDVVLFHGDLGAGKTTFCRALIQHLCGDQTVVPSPTFNLVQIYETDDQILHHYDLYRLPEENAEDDILELGWTDSMNDAITLVEWPDRLGTLAPPKAVHITLKIDHQSSSKRTVIIRKLD